MMLVVPGPRGHGHFAAALVTISQAPWRVNSRPSTNTTGTVIMSQVAVVLFPPMRVVKLVTIR